MFGFLNPALLFAAGAALIPLIIHLFSKRRVKLVEFSSVRHLHTMQKRQVRRIQIKQLLLLATRMLLVIAIVCAFARPTLKNGSIGSHAAVSAVVIVDNSASMNRFVSDGNLFEIAKARTADLLATFSQADQVCLLPLVAGGKSPQQFTSAGAASAELKTLQAIASSGDLGSTLEQALMLFAQSKDLNRELYLVTDRQRGSLPDSLLWQGSTVPVYLVELPNDEQDNLGIVKIDLGGQLISPHQEFAVSATIRNYGSQAATERLASLFVNGRRVAQAEFSAAGGAESTVRFTATVSAAGQHDGYVELSDDRLLADNKRYFSIRIPDQFSVLIVQNDQAAPFLSLALNPGEAVNQYWITKTITPDQISSVNFAEYNVIVLAGLAGLTGAVAERAASAIDRGSSALLLMGGGVDPSTYNPAWSALTGVRVERAMPPVLTRGGYYSLASLELQHPIFSVFRFANGALPTIKFYSLPSVTIADDAAVLMQLSGDHPGLVEKAFGRGRILSMPLSISPDYGDLVTQGFFVPFVSRMVEYLAADLSSLDLDQSVGTVVVRAVPQHAVGTFVSMVRPDSLRFDLSPTESGSSSLTVTAEPAEVAGVYSLRSGDREFDRFVLNLPVNEGDLARYDTAELQSAIGAERVESIPLGESVEPVVAGFRIGTELWPVFLWLALALCAIEMLLSRGNRDSE